jgi:hypothetical protein
MPDYYHSVPPLDLVMRKRHVLFAVMNTIQDQLKGITSPYTIPDGLAEALGHIESRDPLRHFTTAPESRRYTSVKRTFRLANLMWSDRNWTVCVPEPMLENTLYVFAARNVRREHIFELMDTLRHTTYELIAHWNDPVTYINGAKRVLSNVMPVPYSYVERNPLIYEYFNREDELEGSPRIFKREFAAAQLGSEQQQQQGEEDELHSAKRHHPAAGGGDDELPSAFLRYSSESSDFCDALYDSSSAVTVSPCSSVICDAINSIDVFRQ